MLNPNQDSREKRYEETTFRLLDIKEGQLPTYAWLPREKPKAIFIAIHGGMAHGGDWKIPALFFKKRGIATYALDLRYQGHFPEFNSGEKNIFHIDSYNTYANDIHLFYQSIKKENPKIPIFILGHSNGSLISLYYGLTVGKDSDIKGVIVSSPWLKNKVKVSPLLSFVAKILAKLNPKMAISPEPLTDVLTHDKEITARHHKFEEEGIRGTTASPKLSVEFPKAQKFVLENIQDWKLCPLYGIIAGEDHLADPQCSIEALEKVTSVPKKVDIYPQNFHENFNEINRVEIYEKVSEWINQYL